MTGAPNGEPKAAAMNEDAVANLAKAARAEGEALPSLPVVDVMNNKPKVGRPRTVKREDAPRDPLKDIEDLSQLPVAVAVGDVTASVEAYSGRAVLSLSLRGWVGDAPLKILASDVADLEQALADLREQLS